MVDDQDLDIGFLARTADLAAIPFVGEFCSVAMRLRTTIYAGIDVRYHGIFRISEIRSECLGSRLLRARMLLE